MSNEEKTWFAMHQRTKGYGTGAIDIYVNRGIKVCKRWSGKNGLQNFIKDMGNKPSPNHSLDRIDNDGNYTPKNCRWATRTEQLRNRRVFKNNTSGHKGVYFEKTRGQWRANISIEGRRIFKYAKSKEEATLIRSVFEKEYFLT